MTDDAGVPVSDAGTLAWLAGLRLTPAGSALPRTLDLSGMADVPAGETRQFLLSVGGVVVSHLATAGSTPHPGA